MARLQTLIVRRQAQGRRAIEQPQALGLRVGEMAEQPLGIGGLEVEGRELALGLQEDVAVG